MGASEKKNGGGAAQARMWVDEHGDMLYRYALMRVRRSEVAEDLVQETFLAAIQGYANFSGGSSVRTWLVGILRHKVLDYFRQGARQRNWDSLAALEETMQEFFDNAGHWKEIPQQWRANPEKLAENGEFWAIFQECLDGLPEPAADVFVMRELEQKETPEICKELDISSTNLWVRLHRARIQLRRCLEVNWFEAGT